MYRKTFIKCTTKESTISLFEYTAFALSSKPVILEKQQVRFLRVVVLLVGRTEDFSPANKPNTPMTSILTVGINV